MIIFVLRPLSFFSFNFGDQFSSSSIVTGGGSRGRGGRGEIVRLRGMVWETASWRWIVGIGGRRRRSHWDARERSTNVGSGGESKLVVRR
jgi:hypothetical protein